MELEGIEVVEFGSFIKADWDSIETVLQNKPPCQTCAQVRVVLARPLKDGI